MYVSCCRIICIYWIKYLLTYLLGYPVARQCGYYVYDMWLPYVTTLCLLCLRHVATFCYDIVVTMFTTCGYPMLRHCGYHVYDMWLPYVTTLWLPCLRHVATLCYDIVVTMFTTCGYPMLRRCGYYVYDMWLPFVATCICMPKAHNKVNLHSNTVPPSYYVGDMIRHSIRPNLRNHFCTCSNSARLSLMSIVINYILVFPPHQMSQCELAAVKRQIPGITNRNPQPLPRRFVTITHALKS